MNHPTRSTSEGRVYRDLQNKARRDRRPFDELLTLYTLEGFLTRLAHSEHQNTLVLKGGLLLAAYDARRPTGDADFAGRSITNQVTDVIALVRDIAQIATDDGLSFDVDSSRGETIREEDLYSGVRVHIDCRLATAKTHLKVDVNIGDPITPAPATDPHSPAARRDRHHRPPRLPAAHGARRKARHRSSTGHRQHPLARLR